jgi:arginyl-tRNA synthetase
VVVTLENNPTTTIHPNMTTVTLSGLETLVGGLGLKTPIPQFPTADVLNNPLDIGRAYFADVLFSLIDCDKATAYNSIQLPNNIFGGDLAVILPKLSHGGDSSIVGLGVIQKVNQLRSSMRVKCCR